MPLPHRSEHKHERVVEKLAERFERDLEILLAAYRVEDDGGRYAFTDNLTDEEIAERYADPVTRGEIVTNLIATEGHAAAARWIDRAIAATARVERKALPRG